MRKRSLFTIIISVLFLFGLSGCGLITKTPEAELKVAVATINGEKITKGDYQKELQSELKRYEMLYQMDISSQPEYLSSFKQQVLQQMAQQVLQLQKAKELKIVVDDKTVDNQVNKSVDEFIKYVGGKKKFEEQLKTSGVTEAEYRSTLKEQYSKQMTIDKLNQYLTKDVKVTDQEVNTYYYTNQYNYTEKPNVMNVAHILLPTQEQANKVLKEIKAGLKFADAAKKYSTDSGNKDKGGLIGDIEYTTTDYDKKFVTAAIQAPIGVVTAPIQTDAGFHLILVNSKKEYKIKPLDKVKADVKKTVLDQKKNDLINSTFQKWEQESKIDLHTDLI